jgi:hypothetical protein
MVRMSWKKDSTVQRVWCGFFLLFFGRLVLFEGGKAIYGGRQRWTDWFKLSGALFYMQKKMLVVFVVGVGCK